MLLFLNILQDKPWSAKTSVNDNSDLRCFAFVWSSTLMLFLSLSIFLIEFEADQFCVSSSMLVQFRQNFVPLIKFHVTPGARGFSCVVSDLRQVSGYCDSLWPRGFSRDLAPRIDLRLTTLASGPEVTKAHRKKTSVTQGKVVTPWSGWLFFKCRRDFDPLVTGMPLMRTTGGLPVCDIPLKHLTIH